MQPVRFERWIADNLDLNNIEDVLELFEAITSGRNQGRWVTNWYGEELIVEGAVEELPLHSRSSRDTFLDILRQQRNG